MVVAANDMGDAHVVIVDDDGEHVGRIAVGAQQHEIVEILVGEGDAALHLVVDDGLAVLARAQADRRRHARRRLGGVAVAPAAVVARRQAGEPLLLAHFGKFFRRAIAAIGVAGLQQLHRGFAVARDAGELVDDLAVPIEFEPAQAVEDRLDRLRRRALAVGVLDAQQELAADVLGVEPVEQRRARPADMQEAGGRGRETGDDGGHGALWRQEAAL